LHKKCCYFFSFFTPKKNLKNTQKKGVTFVKTTFMHFENPVSAKWLADFIGAKIIGDAQLMATGINEINRVTSGDIVFVDHPKYYDKCINSAANFILINKEVACPAGKVLLVTDIPFAAYDKIVQHFRPFEKQLTPISNTAIIDESAIIYPNVFIGHDVRIGKNCVIYPNVSIYDHTTIGDNVTIHANTTIGSHAFYYNTKKDRELWYKKMYSCGTVVIENDVEIGAGCTIDKGVSSATIIGAGTKIDNQCHIAHDVEIGKNCLIAAQVGIAGATTLEDGVTIWAQTGVNKTLTIGANAVIMARSGVPGNTEGGKVYWGSPIQDVRAQQKELIWIKRIPELWEKVMKK
jgi:UDP-3-O-[3-hydroxymyristoyl] glucosamine N-acyltransferase